MNFTQYKIKHNGEKITKMQSVGVFIGNKSQNTHQNSFIIHQFMSVTGLN